MTWFRVGGGSGVPADLKSEMNSVLNKKFGTSTDYPPNDWPETVNLMGPLEEKTVSGSIASFPDGADDVPIKSLVANLPASLTPYESIEVIHAGGNILETNAQSKTQNGITWTVNQDGSVTLEGTSTARTYLYVHGYHKIISKDATLTVSVEGLKDNGAYDVFVNLTYSEDGTLYAGTYGQLTYDHPSKTIQYTADKYIGILIDCPANVTTNQTIKIMVSGGSSAMDFEPYEAPTTYEIEIPNPNPNLFDKSAEHNRATWNTDGSLNTDNYDHFAYRIAVEEKTAYTIVGQWFDRMIVFFDSNDNFISYVQPTMTDNKMKVTTPAGAAVMGVSVDFIAAAFDGNAIKKDFNVYGGSIDAISGEDAGKCGKIVFDGSETRWSAYTTGNGYAIPLSGMERGTWYTSDLALSYPIPKAPNNDNLGVRIGVNNDGIYVVQANTIEGVTDLASFKAYLAEHPLTVIYPMATPEAFQTEPIAVNSKTGANNIWNDAGDSSVTYRSAGTMTPDLPTLIEKTITENGEYLASSDNADGFSKVTVNVESIVKIGVNSGKLNITNGTITADDSYCYTDLFDCPSGMITLDVGEGIISDFAGIELVNESDGSHTNYWQGASRYRELDLTNYYSATKKARLAFKKQYLSKVLLMDFGNGKIYSSLTAAQFEETQTE